MALDTVSILDGNTFVVSDRRGDLDATPTDNHGLFLNDTRFLSRWVLTVDGRRPTCCRSTSRPIRGCSSSWRWRPAPSTSTRTCRSCAGARSASAGSAEEIDIVNHGNEPIDLEVKLEAAADFADLFEVKDKLEKKGELYRSIENGSLRSATGARLTGARRGITSQRRASCATDGPAFRVHLRAAGATGRPTSTSTRRIARGALGAAAARHGSRARPTEVGHRGLGGAGAPAGQLVGAAASDIYRRSLVDLAALRFRTSARRRGRCRPPACRGSWRCSAATA